MDIKTILMAVSCLFMMLFPVIFSIIVGKKAYGKFTIAFIGVAGYLVANYGLNALINLISGNAIENMFETNETLAFFLDELKQGFVEEIIRFILMLLCMKNSLQKQNSLMYAAGHGGIEMIIRVAELYVPEIITAIKTPEESPFEEMPIFSPFIIPLVFIFTFCLHIGLSYLVFRAVKDKKYPLVILAIVLHMLANFSTTVEIPLVPLLGPFVIVIGLLIYTIISYKNDVKMDFYE